MTRWQHDQQRRAIHAALSANAKRIAAAEAASEAVGRGLRGIWAAITKIEDLQVDLDHRVTALERELARARQPHRVPVVTAARRLGLSTASVRRLIAAGDLAGAALQLPDRERRVWVVDLASVERFERAAGAVDAEMRLIPGPGARETKG